MVLTMIGVDAAKVLAVLGAFARLCVWRWIIVGVLL